MQVGAYAASVAMLVDSREAEIVRHLLMPGEIVEGTIKQRKLRPGGDLLTPTTLVATDRRLVIIYRTTLGMRKYYEIIPYRRITSVRIEHGIMSSSLHLNILGVDKGKVLRQGKEEGVIEGLREREAGEFGKFLNQKLMEASNEGQRSDTSDLEVTAAATVFCRACGAKESTLSKFCRNCGTALLP